MENKDLKAKYDEMHSQGPSAWFGQGEEERRLILEMGEPWENKVVLEIGCGEGQLSKEIFKKGAYVAGIDYSAQAILKAKEKIESYPKLVFLEMNYKACPTFCKYNTIVMQGVLEHLDNPFDELKWMMDNLLSDHGDVITSSPCFLNPRGIVWMALDMLGAVMSKTDLHYLNPCDFQNFCHDNHYSMDWETCDYGWAQDVDMVSDLRKRIPLALKDGNLPYSEEKFLKFIEWLDCRLFCTNHGATAVYKISK